MRSLPKNYKNDLFSEADANLCLRCGQRPKLPPIVWGGKVVATPNLCEECEAAEISKALARNESASPHVLWKEVMPNADDVRSTHAIAAQAAPTFDPKAAANLCRACEEEAANAKR